MGGQNRWSEWGCIRLEGERNVGGVKRWRVRARGEGERSGGKEGDIKKW